jgi:hypothetical protein
LACVLALGCQTRERRFMGAPPEPTPPDRATVCLDQDGDGHGLRCPAGPDCDDADPSFQADCPPVCGDAPVAGCACEPGAEPVECHSPRPELDAHGRLVCRVGAQGCVDGVWSECLYDDAFVIDSQFRAVGGSPVPCGNCDPQCYETGGLIEEDEITAENSEGVSYGCIDDDGPGDGDGDGDDGVLCGLVIGTGDPGGGDTERYAYIALEPSHGSVTKIRMSDGEEVARYFVGFPAETNNRPSRTAIDSLGDAYVANRGNVSVSGGASFMGSDGDIFGSVTKIAGAASRCDDRDLNGVIDTSNTNAELPEGTDECVLWNVSIGEAEGSIPRAMAVDRGDLDHPQGIPWVGTSIDVDNVANQGGRAYQLDPDDGTILQSIQLPLNAYGAMADGGDPQRMWFTSYLTGGLASVEVATGTVEGPFYPNMPDGHSASAYAITTDGRRIWRAGGNQEYVRSYDPATGEHCLVDLPATKVVTKRTLTKGIAVRLNADGTKEVWVTEAISQGKLWHFDADTPCASAATNGLYCKTWNPRLCMTTVTETRNENWYPGAGIGVVDLGAGNNTPLGLGLDFDNRVWAVNNITNNIAVYDPEDGTQVEYPPPLALRSPGPTATPTSPATSAPPSRSRRASSGRTTGRRPACARWGRPSGGATSAGAPSCPPAPASSSRPRPPVLRVTSPGRTACSSRRPPPSRPRSTCTTC